MTTSPPSSNLGSASCRRILLLGKFFVILFPSIYATCYFPNGDIQADIYYQPCHPDQKHSMCCRPSNNRCRSDGLCEELGTLLIWRETCTDPTWNSSSCVKLCNSGLVFDVEGQENDQAGHDHLITPCDDGSYCCGNGDLASNCCKENRGLFLQNGTAVSRSTSIAIDVVSSSSKKATPLSSSNAALTLVQSLDAFTPTASASSFSTTKSSNQTGVIVGAAIGGAAVLALMTGIVVLIRIRCIKQKSLSQETQNCAICEDPTNDDCRELAAIGPAPELGISERSPRPVPELQGFEFNRSVRELEA